MRVLIIGCGYVGLPLGAELVRQGHQVFGLRRNPGAEADLKAAGITPLAADITQPEDLARLPADYEWAVNCVASSGGGTQAYRAVYLEGMRNLVAWLSAAPLKKFAYTSSTSVYGQTDGSIVTEKSVTEPEADTAQVLLEAEQVLLQAAQQKGFPAVILRLAGIYGPERGYWFKQYLKNEATIEGRGERFLNMIHRDDVVGAVTAALKNGRPGQVYNAADDQPVTQIDFFRWLANTLGRGLPPATSPNPQAARKRGSTNKQVSNRKLKEELGYHFKFPTFREGYAAELQRQGVAFPKSKP